MELSKQKMMQFIKNQMDTVAPNLCEIVGSSVAAKLIASSGGIIELSKMPACNI
jgi:U4/U6 small nuclear ribonucleoprotein PRP31